ncbi:DUF3696 domain-containing protein [Sphingobacterium thalpophilum]|uniref:DUF3696 domain-containing protein n=1 Tax=Sphingobacterium thalpophilum TaxID=259 RepID=UPI003DA22AA7
MSYRLVGLGIQNFRIFKDFQYFNIKPITLLTGTNSAGKSTFAKALLMLKKSFDTTVLNSLVLNSSVTNLGTLSDIVPYGSDGIDTTFVLHIQQEHKLSLLDQGADLHNLYVLKLVYREGILHRFVIEIDRNIVASATIHSSNGFLSFKDSYFHYPEELIQSADVFNVIQEDMALFPEIKAELLQFLRNTDSVHNPDTGILAHNKTANIFSTYVNLCLENVVSIGQVTMYVDEENWSMNRDYALHDVLSDELKSRVLNRSLLDKSVSEFINGRYRFDPLFSTDFLSVFQTINSNVLEYNINDTVISRHKYPNIYNSLISNEFEVGFFNEEVETLQGFLYYWIVERLKLVKPSSNFNNKSFGYFHSDENKQFIRVIDGNEWGELIKIEIFADNRWVPLSSLGFGTANIILKIVQLIKHNNVLVVEEPEANLHPSLQSKLADLVALSTELKHHHSIVNPLSWQKGTSQEDLDIIGGKIDLSGSTKIIETHSEYFIRRLQYLVASETSPLSADDVQIYYFNNPLEEDFDPTNQVVDIKIQQNGSLTENFGSGFMDEADNIALELYLLQYK